MVDLGNRLFYRAAEIAPADTVFDRNIALILFPVNLLSAILHFHLGQLRERNSFAGGRKQANVFDGFLRVAIRLLVAGHQVIAGFPLQYLADGASADRGLDGILYVTDIDTVTSRRLAVDNIIEVGLADHAEDAEILDPANLTHDAHNLVGPVLQFPQVIAVKLDRQLAFHAADRFLYVVGDGLGEVPYHAWHFLQFAIHGSNQFFFVLVEGGAPLFLGQQVDKIFRVEETGRIGAIVGPSHLGDHLGHLWKRGENDARPVHGGDAGRRTGARAPAYRGPRSRLHPDGAETRNQSLRLIRESPPESERTDCDADGHGPVFNGPGRGMAVVIRNPRHHRVVPFARALPKEKTRQHGSNQHGEDQRAEQGKRHRPCHGLEQPAFHRLQSKDGQISGDDDADGVKNGPLHFVSGFTNLLHGGRAVGAAAAEMADDVLHHDDRAVHHHAEVKCAQR